MQIAELTLRGRIGNNVGGRCLRLLLLDYPIGDQLLDNLLLHAKTPHKSIHWHDDLLGWGGTQFLFAILSLNGHDRPQVDAD